MSQKTNPISLRLQKTNLSFPLSFFADYFWSDIYQTCFENQKYLSAFLKESCYSQAIFSARVFYRKFSIFLFVQDNRLSEKNTLFFFKNKGKQNTTPALNRMVRSFTKNNLCDLSSLTKKDLSSLLTASSSALTHGVVRASLDRKNQFFAGGDSDFVDKKNTEDSSTLKVKFPLASYKSSLSPLAKKRKQFFLSPKTIEGTALEQHGSLNNEKQWLVKVFQHDFLRVKQGFFFTISPEATPLQSFCENKGYVASGERDKENSLSFKAKASRPSNASLQNSFRNCSFLNSMRLFPAPGTHTASKSPFAFAFTSLNKEAIAYSYLSMKDKNRVNIFPSIPLPIKIFHRPCLAFCERVLSLDPKQGRANNSLNNALLSDKNEKRLSLYIAEKSHVTPSVSLSPSVLPSSSLKDSYTSQRIVKPSIDSHEALTYKKEDMVPSLSAYQSCKPKEMQSVSYKNEGSISLTVKTKQNFFKSLTFRKNLSFFPRQITLEPIRFLNEDQNVIAVLDIVVTLLEKRISFRQIKSFLFRQLSLKPQIKGMRISCSGRLGGRSKKAQKAKVQCDTFGTTTLSTFSSKIIFASKSAFTPYGKIGVKIWLSYQEAR